MTDAMAKILKEANAGFRDPKYPAWRYGADGPVRVENAADDKALGAGYYDSPKKVPGGMAEPAGEADEPTAPVKAKAKPATRKPKNKKAPATAPDTGE